MCETHIGDHILDETSELPSGRLLDLKDCNIGKSSSSCVDELLGSLSTSMGDIKIDIHCVNLC